MTAKPDLRKELRAARKAMALAERRTAADIAARNFLQHRKLAAARRVALYRTNGSELDTTPLIDALLDAHREVFLPVVTSGTALKLVRVLADSPMRRGRHGIVAPAAGTSIRLGELDLVVVPLLAFDARGHRLGSGAGYYDRLLARPRPFRRPLVVGYAYAAQERARLPDDPWDRKLDALVTERGVTWFKRS